MQGREPFLQDQRGKLFLKLIPPLVHRMNNSLAVLNGAAESLERSSGSLPVRAELDRIGETLRSISYFAKSHLSIEEFFQLDSIVHTVELLLIPLATTSGVDLECRTEGGVGVVSGDCRRIEQLLIALVASEVNAVALENQAALQDPTNIDPQPRMRLTLRTTPNRATFTLVRPVSLTIGAENSAMVQVAADHAEELGMELLARTMGGATALRFRFKSLPPFEEEPPAQADGASVLLVERDSSLSDLMSLVLADAGYKVEALPALESVEDLAGRFDLILFDTDHEREHPGVLDDLLQFDSNNGGVLLLGTTDDALAGEPHMLIKPFRPQELLAAVEEML